MPTFSLSKWYMDCVGDDGSALVAYAAELRWGALVLHYASALERPAAGEPRASSSLARAPLPTLEGEVLTWSSRALGIEGRWRSLSAPIEATVFASPDGSVMWRCHQPLARAEIVLPSGARLSGLGYTERLDLTLAPWKMPIDELRWGRFTGERDSVVWIDWRGPYDKRLVYHDGCLVDRATVGQEAIESEDGALRLAIHPGVVLREGALGRTALSVIPDFERLFPAGILATEERKWLARGTLTTARGTAHGWVIHEVVRWR
jgi:hypothetical protein